MDTEKAALIAHYAGLKSDALRRLNSIRLVNVAGISAERQRELDIQRELAEAEYLEALKKLAKVKP